MTTTTAASGASVAAAHDHVEQKDYSTIMFLIAAAVLVVLVGATVFMGIGGLILVGVAATWIMLALLVVITAGG